MARTPTSGSLKGLSDSCRQAIKTTGLEVVKNGNQYLVGEFWYAADALELYMDVYMLGWYAGIIALRDGNPEALRTDEEHRAATATAREHSDATAAARTSRRALDLG